MLRGGPGYTAAMRTRPSILAPLALLLVLQLVACGNKGPLVRASADEAETVEETVDDAAEEGLEDQDVDPEPAQDDVPAGQSSDPATPRAGDGNG